jgi:hypothetical protein
MVNPIEWKSFGFEFKPGKLVFGEYKAQGRFLFVRDARGSIKASDWATSFDPDCLPDAG